MSDRLAAAQAALSAGRRLEAIDQLIAAISEDPAREARVYRVLAAQLYSAGRHAEGEVCATRGLERFPRDYELLNLRGVLLRRLQRQTEAVAPLEQAIKLNPKSPMALQNLGNVLLDLNEPARAESLFAKLARAEPRNSENHRLLGRSLSKQGKIEPALVRFRQAVSLKRDNIDGWLDLIGSLNEENRTKEAEETLEKALAANPGEQRLLEGKVLMLRRSGQIGRAESFLRELLPANPEAAWLHHQLGLVIGDRNRDEANGYLARALELDPSRIEHSIALVESLERTRTGDEGANIERSYQLAKTLLPRKLEFNASGMKAVTEVFVRVCDYDAVAQVGDLRSLGRVWANSGLHTALLKQLPRVRSDGDRLELLEQHRIWGRSVEAAVSRRPIKRPPPRPAGGKIRLGFLSSDLRQHPVGYFAMPLFDHIDGERFEVFVYSFFQGAEDAVQRAIASKITAYRWWPDISIPEAAEKIAEDQLDVLIELGGSTHMNKPEVMAYRPAAIQASWLGYPHSVGLEAIDYLLVDPYVQPEDSKLLVEKPLPLRNAWYGLGSLAFREEPGVNPQSPAARNGYVTFGTANQPYKYNPELFAAWAAILRQVPDSRFLFVRPEGSSPSFRENIIRHFEAGGVSVDRIRFEAVRGRHLPYYNEMDISLDPFPQTGGTSTCEALWMGVPVITKVGPTMFERLSYSVLANLELPEFCAWTTEGYVEAAVTLARDQERLGELRRTLRDRMKASPLGRTDLFARDYYDVIAEAVRGSGR